MDEPIVVLAFERTVTARSLFFTAGLCALLVVGASLRYAGGWRKRDTR
ncbi:MAG: hypothetical protein JRI23_29080 [Deltaproteobacteria bacterium]|jgi:hypothetical protein|nr:hypothetical protein [Deltaproteobacteria bacterium]MBW2536185.1 hypothetical protein [Deltaproteobacteria bacterium]